MCLESKLFIAIRLKLVSVWLWVVIEWREWGVGGGGMCSPHAWAPDVTSSHQMPSDTKLWYCAMLRLRMSEQGPRTRSKRCRSSLTHLSWLRAITVAARGRSRMRAISPETYTRIHWRCGTNWTLNVDDYDWLIDTHRNNRKVQARSLAPLGHPLPEFDVQLPDPKKDKY